MLQTPNIVWRSAVVFVFTACASSRGTSPEPAIEPAPAPLPVPEALPRNTRTSWTLLPSNEPTRYVSTTVATIQSDSGFTVTRDTVSQQTRFTLLTATNSGSTTFLGTITEISNLPGSRIGSGDRVSALPISFTGHIANGLMRIDELNGRIQGEDLDCTDPMYSALSSIQRRVVVVPPEITSGIRWTDSLTARSCNGLVPILTTSIRNSRVLGEAEINGTAAILIERSERSLSTGEGSEGQHRILLKGETSGSARLYIDAHTGALLRSEGEQRTNLLITAGRSRRFTQVVTEKTTAER